MIVAVVPVCFLRVSIIFFVSCCFAVNRSSKSSPPYSAVSFVSFLIAFRSSSVAGDVGIFCL